MGFSLCEQHPYDPADGNCIKVSFHSTKKREEKRVDITIPLPKMTKAEVAKTKVHFDLFGGIVLIFIPGHYIRLLDNRNDYHLNALFPPEMANFPKDLQLENYSLKALTTHLTAANPNKGLFVNQSTGTFAMYKINQESVLEMAVSDFATEYLRKQLLYLVHFHLQDDGSSGNSILRSWMDNPRRMTKELFKEFFIGSTYCLFSAKLPKGADTSNILAALPFTTLPSYDQCADVSSRPIDQPLTNRNTFQ